MPSDLPSRFSSRVRPTESCLLWQGEVRKPSGYGVYTHEGRRTPAHKFAWEAAKGPVPTNRTVRHRCGNKHCVNVEHLFLAPYGKKKETLRSRFWRHVSASEPSACWLWQGAPHTSGYGRLLGVNGSMDYAHRISWVLYNGPLGPDDWVAHHCDTPLCVNPAHLFLSRGNRDNMADAVRKGRTARGTRHGNSKLTDDQVRYIREAYMAGGITQQALADEVGCSRSYVSQLVGGCRRPAVT